MTSFERTEPLRGGGQRHITESDPSGEPICDLLLIHGYGEHSGRYAPMIEKFVGMGARVVAYDHRGHGRTTGIEQGSVESLPLLVDDAQEMLDSTHHNGRPTFIFGHSMGGLIATLLAERQDQRLAGAIIASPSLAPASSIPPALVKVANVLGKIAPKLRTIALDGTTISRNPEVVADYDRDPLNFRGKLTARTGRELNMGMIAAHRDAHLIECPVLLLHGEQDQLTNVDGSRQLMVEMTVTDKTLKTWPEAFHELHHEPEAAEEFEVIADWIRAHLS